MEKEAQTLMLEMLMHQCDLLIEIRDELQAIREATEAEAVEDAEPDPFQTLNGPVMPTIPPSRDVPEWQLGK